MCFSVACRKPGICGERRHHRVPGFAGNRSGGVCHEAGNGCREWLSEPDLAQDQPPRNKQQIRGTGRMMMRQFIWGNYRRLGLERAALLAFSGRAKAT
jgi:hypothetical protein